MNVTTMSNSSSSMMSYSPSSSALLSNSSRSSALLSATNATGTSSLNGVSSLNGSTLLLSSTMTTLNETASQSLSSIATPAPTPIPKVIRDPGARWDLVAVGISAIFIIFLCAGLLYKFTLASIPRSFKCNKCGKVYPQKNFLKNHVRLRHAKKAKLEGVSNNCPICKKKCQHPAHLKSHVKLRHPDKFEKWEALQKKVIAGHAVGSNEDWLKNEGEPVTESRKFECEFCKKKCAHRAHLMTHIKMRHPKQLEEWIAQNPEPDGGGANDIVSEKDTDPEKDNSKDIVSDREKTKVIVSEKENPKKRAEELHEQPSGADDGQQESDVKVTQDESNRRIEDVSVNQSSSDNLKVQDGLKPQDDVKTQDTTPVVIINIEEAQNDSVPSQPVTVDADGIDKFTEVTSDQKSTPSQLENNSNLHEVKPVEREETKLAVGTSGVVSLENGNKNKFPVDGKATNDNNIEETDEKASNQDVTRVTLVELKQFDKSAKTDGSQNKISPRSPRRSPRRSRSHSKSKKGNQSNGNRERSKSRSRVTPSTVSKSGGAPRDNTMASVPDAKIEQKSEQKSEQLIKGGASQLTTEGRIGAVEEGDSLCSEKSDDWEDSSETQRRRASVPKGRVAGLIARFQRMAEV